ncbi:MAG TPA: ATP-binding protein [Thermoanaerobaculia bacterium]|jgi:two-component system phosphate regulon sensor histidine kinase PhoR|nr:ATP-binding protein [Thermoanaerobaculia bacterium]
MHPLRVLLYVSLVIAIAVAWGFGAALRHAGTAQSAATVLAIVAFIAFMIPWTGVFLWAVRRANDLDMLTDRSRAALETPAEPVVADQPYHAELDDLARSIEELRATILRQRDTHDEHRAAMAEIVSSLGEGLLAVSPRGRVVFANSRFADMFDSGKDLVGRSVLEVVRKQSVMAAIDRALRGEATTDRVAVGTGDHERQIEVRAVPVASAEIAAVALFIDVTTIERLQRVRKEFLDDFSHEVRTPLAGLKSASETLQHRDGLTQEYEQQLRSVMERQIARIERLVNDLSELNRIETGELVLQKRPVNLRAVLGELVDDFQERSGSVQFTLHGDDLVATIDALRAQQIFTNLLDNACKHGGGRGEVSVEIERDNGDAVVRVSDQGPGIPPQDIDRVFHRFYRIDRSRSQPGTGLGLAIAKHLVALHGGSIRAFNRPEGGATFEVRLPIELT